MDPQPSEARADAGFTLIETMIAVVVLIFGLVSVANLFIMAGTSNFVANQSTAAASVASAQLDYLLLAAGSDTPHALGGDLTTNLALAPTCPGGPANFSCVQEVPGAATVEVRWTLTPINGNATAITVEAEPLTGLARRQARVRLIATATCTSPNPALCPPITNP